MVQISLPEEAVGWFPIEDKLHNFGYLACIHVHLQITKAYVTSRLESVETVLRENLENPLDDKTMVSQQLDQLATIGRYNIIIMAA